MPRAKAPEIVSQLYADVPVPDMVDHARVEALLDRVRADQRIDGQPRATVRASLRPDAAGSPANLFRTATSYQQRVIAMWEAYNTDPFFASMIDRTVAFACTGGQWVVPGEPLDGEKVSWVTRLTESAFPWRQAVREERVWNEWWKQINLKVPGVLSGGDEVTRWAARHLLLSGMWVPAWEWGKFDLGNNRSFMMPQDITCYSSSAIQISRKRNSFVEEEIFFYSPYGQQTQGRMVEGEPAEAPSRGNSSALTPLPQMEWVDRVQPGHQESFSLKYNWSPGDLTTMKIGQAKLTGAGIYPKPPFQALIPQFMIRQKMFSADMALLDGIINYLMLYKIGDEKNPVKPRKINKATGAVLEQGTIAQIIAMTKDAFTQGPGVAMYLPYWVDVVLKIPDVKNILNSQKYDASTLEIYQAFGMLFSRSSAGSRDRMEKINITNFEETLGTIRSHVGGFMNMLARKIWMVNQRRTGFQSVPLWVWNPLNTKDEAYKQVLLQARKYGNISAYTFLQALGIEPYREFERIGIELATDADDMFDAAAPVAYVQRSDIPQPDFGKDPGGTPPADTTPNGGGTETKTSPSALTGRPKTKLTARRGLALR